MKVTAQEEYGLRCLLQLASAKTGDLVNVKDIAQREGISSAYAEKLLRFLARAGLVHSVRGAKGGYILNRPPSTISLGEVMRALGTIETTEHICSSYTGNEESCVHFDGCSIRSVWSGLTTYIQRFLDQTTMESLLEDEYTVSERLGSGLVLHVSVPKKKGRSKDDIKDDK